MNQEELITLGEGAEQLLSSEAFTVTVNSLVDASFQTFTNSKPGELENREQAYHHYRALVDIVNTLQQRVTVKDEIVAKAADNSNQEEDD
jgi:hypothetical protein